MTTKQRAYLKSLAMTMEPIFQIGKSSMTPGLTEAIAEALEARELIKISVMTKRKSSGPPIPAGGSRKRNSPPAENAGSIRSR